MYRQLDAQKIVDTANTLQSRVSERFPGSGLSRLAAEVSTAARETIERSRWIRKPHLPLRIPIYLLLATILGLFVGTMASLELPKLKEFGEFIQVLEAGLSAMFFISAFVIFLVTWESRIKRDRALKAIHELRSMAHIVDMHQLTKTPDAFFFAQNGTASSPRRTLSAFELGRYLDYCSELLSLIGKVAALYSHSLDDPVVLEAVDDVEDLTTELSQKIWQKITLLDTLKLQSDPLKPENCGNPAARPGLAPGQAV
jgi:hypothetical protein